MLKDIIKKKVLTSLVISIFIIIIFTTLGLIHNIKTKDMWTIKYHVIYNEKSFIYLSNIDELIKQMEINLSGSGDNINLRAQIVAMTIMSSPIINSIIPEVFNVTINPSWLIFDSHEKNGLDKTTEKMINIVNRNINKKLNTKLKLCYDVGKESFEEENAFNKSQLILLKKKIEESIGAKEYLRLDTIIDLFVFNGINFQATEVSDLRKKLYRNGSETFDNMVFLRKKYSEAGLMDQLHFVRFERLMENLKNTDFISVKNLQSRVNRKSSMFISLVTGAITGLSIAILFSYFYIIVFNLKTREKYFSWLLKNDRE